MKQITKKTKMPSKSIQNESRLTKTWFSRNFVHRSHSNKLRLRTFSVVTNWTQNWKTSKGKLISVFCEIPLNRTSFSPTFIPRLQLHCIQIQILFINTQRQNKNSSHLTFPQPEKEKERENLFGSQSFGWCHSSPDI